MNDTGGGGNGGRSGLGGIGTVAALAGGAYLLYKNGPQGRAAASAASAAALLQSGNTRNIGKNALDMNGDLMQDYIKRAAWGERKNQETVAEQIDDVLNTPMPARASADSSIEQLRLLPQASYDSSKYGDVIQLLQVLVAATSALVLPRNTNKRTYLVIQNPSAAPLYMAFGQQANTGSLPIPAGGNAWFDTFVPQNDIYLFSTPGALIPIYYATHDIFAA